MAKHSLFDFHLQVLRQNVRALGLLALILVATSTPARAGYDEAAAALVRGDYKTAFEELRPLAEQGDPDVQTMLGKMFEHGKGVPQDYGEAAKWYRKAAEQGDKLAQYGLGRMYGSGRGVPQDYSEALQWLQQAAEQGHVVSQFLVGLMYGNGKGVPQDYGEAAKWYRKAAEQGHANAQHNLGSMYAKGNGVPQDYVEAHKWFNLAAANSPGEYREQSVTARDVIAEMMTPAQIAEAQRLAREWMEQHEAK